MNILIVAATQAEVKPLLNKLTIKAQTGNFSMCSYKSINVDVLITGVGMTATAYHLGKFLSKKYDFALNLGLAGAFNKNIDLGEVVNVTYDRFSELGAEDGDNFLTLAEIKLQDENEFPFTKGELVNSFFSKNKIIDELPKVSGVTVNTVHGNEESIEKIISRYHPYVESMEGAAFLFACLTEKIPCAQVRAISNYVEKRNRDAWKIPLAIENLNKKALEILDGF